MKQQEIIHPWFRRSRKTWRHSNQTFGTIWSR